MFDAAREKESGGTLVLMVGVVAVLGGRDVGVYRGGVVCGVVVRRGLETVFLCFPCNNRPFC